MIAMDEHSWRSLDHLELIIKLRGIRVLAKLIGHLSNPEICICDLLALPSKVLLDHLTDLFKTIARDPRRHSNGGGVDHHAIAPHFFGYFDQRRSKGTNALLLYLMGIHSHLLIVDDPSPWMDFTPIGLEGFLVHCQEKMYIIGMGVDLIGGDPNLGKVQASADTGHIVLHREDVEPPPRQRQGKTGTARLHALTSFSSNPKAHIVYRHCWLISFFSRSVSNRPFAEGPVRFPIIQSQPPVGGRSG